MALEEKDLKPDEKEKQKKQLEKLYNEHVKSIKDNAKSIEDRLTIETVRFAVKMKILNEKLENENKSVDLEVL